MVKPGQTLPHSRAVAATHFCALAGAASTHGSTPYPYPTIGATSFRTAVRVIHLVKPIVELMSGFV